MSAMGIRIDVSRGFKQLERQMTDFQRRQLPFAAMTALNAVAAQAAVAETAGIEHTFGPVTPFTKRAIGVIRASKSTLTATVFVKDIQAGYLAPYLPGGSGVQVLHGKAILEPIELKTNRYGNIPKGKLAALKARPDIFIGGVKIGGQTINGVWQRVGAATRPVAGRRRPRKPGKASGLKLLIRFADPEPVKPRLDYGAPTAQVVKHGFGPAFAEAFAAAMATARD